MSPRLLKLLLLGLAVYLAMLGTLYIRQRELVFPRDPARAEIASAGLAAAEEASVTTADGERLVAWVVPPRAGKPVVLYFHGNAGNLGATGRIERFRGLARDGLGIFAVSYRGYGGSTGAPSEEGLLQDARAAYGAAAARFGAGRLVGYGESLGTGVVLKLAAEVPFQAVVLEAPYRSALAVAQGLYPYLPLALVMKDQFRSDEVIGRLRAPLLVLHGELDEVIPFAQGRQLYELANAPKRFLRFPAGRHSDLPRYGSVGEITRFLADAAEGGIAAAESRTIGEGAASRP
ncbi:MAG: alpha/beta fold hydrolase [Bosea sp.]|uniref:alpha/beta hydrolase n=1 Tax=Bosea sp. (in: a-proteobacteria) TaxID=1871050 RepID=UPI001AC0D318|nr:alpha/beta fold hydrolase [Bosea sp. (in: a-proteobacteria)]MBN9452388.1 alpha/beta fold hydrolase [Bosea sp. (in: a-proteobacteria)]